MNDLKLEFYKFSDELYALQMSLLALRVELIADKALEIKK